MNGLNLSALPWIRTRGGQVAKELVEDFVYWLLNSFIIDIIKAG